MSKTSLQGGSFTAETNGEVVRRLRGEIKQRELEEAAGIPRGNLTRMETGKSVSIKLINKLAEHFKVHPKILLSDSALKITGDLLSDLATLRGVRIDFVANREDREKIVWIEECIYCHIQPDGEIEYKACQSENSLDNQHKFGKVSRNASDFQVLPVPDNSELVMIK